MSHISLAARYRPQTFAAVAGQPLAAVALSHAAAQGRVAPAYLLSGTRGVGKTTIARIFAKALNCERGPAAEPCNECSQCRHITAGNHVDVNEIDGASNTGVDDVRALRETIGFMPMEGRYKVFIVDEAHMLSKSAFNALLKTLEEPPPNTVFIFATTEAHRFPATIISRCQHYVFRHLPEQAIFDHLARVLQQENIKYEDGAVRLLAKRAAGSVRDSLSLLDQTLSVISGSLDAETVRRSLGIAGPELFGAIFAAIAARDCAAIINLAGSLLSSGADLGFFMRELIAWLRNLFLFRQEGEKILPALDLTPDENSFLKENARLFSAAHLHAAWQMALEGQRSLAQSPSPGAALELLLINLAILPQLLPVGSPSVESAPREAPASARFAEEEPVRPYGPETAGTKTADTERTWAGFREFCRQRLREGKDAPADGMLAPLAASWKQDTLEVDAPQASLHERLTANRKLLETALAEYCGGNPPKLAIKAPRLEKSREELMDHCKKLPEVQLCSQILGASLTNCSEITPGG